jgi:predicted Zn finger-like uncharacterized protein
MSLITQCPACATMFKVVPDQLRISDGWVRCGQCDEVFDANAHLYADQELSSVLETAPHEAPSAAGNAWVSSLKFDSQTETPDAEVASASVDGHEVPEADFSVSSTAPDLVVDVPDIEISPAHAIDQVMSLSPGLPPDPILPTEVVAQAAVPEAPQVPRYAQAQTKTVAGADLNKLSFMRQARRKALWQHVAVRLSLGVLSLVLLAALALQVAYVERDRIAATEPDSRVLLEMMCEWLDCQVQPWRKIESVVIDSSAFSKVQGDVYRLNFTLKSTSIVPVAVPALELTLTDMQDRTVLRRVVLTKELSSTKSVLEPGAEMSVTLPLRVKTSLDDERISGYRLLAFYP